MIDRSDIVEPSATAVLADCFLQNTTTFDLHSERTGCDYQVRVSVPPGYESAADECALLIVLDGAMLFGTAIETVAVQTSTGEIKPTIVAAINTRGSMGEHNLRRLRDYTPAGLGNPSSELLDENPVLQRMANQFESQGMDFTSGLGGASFFQAFLEQELLPELRSRYHFDDNQLGLFGHSAAGAFVVSALLSGKSVFRKFIIGTFGTLWWGETLAEALSSLAPSPSHSVHVFYGYGGGEVRDFGEEPIQQSIDLMHQIQAAAPGYVESLEIRCFKHEQHGSIMAPVLASGVHELWCTRTSYQDAIKR